jgi:NhaP-type Na+/H+ or K+/H+ antiporter
VLILGVFFLGLFVYGLLARVFDRRGVTPQIVALALGLAVGIAIAGTSEVKVDTEILHIAGEAALVLCLFVDAARIQVPALRGSAALPARLLAIGLPLTVIAGALVALVVLPGIDLLDAVILAALVAPTDAALGSAVVSSPLIPLRIRQALNVESGLNDGLVTPLVLVGVVIANSPESGSPTGWVADAVAQIGLGTVAGVVVGVGGAVLLRVAMRRGWVMPASQWMIAPALAALAWAVAEGVGGNIFIAAFVAGLAATASFGRIPDDLLEFGEVSGELLGLAVFFLFGALVPSLGPYEPAVILFAGLALTVVRMAPVAISLIRTGLAPETVAFVAWFGPRGLASIVLAVVALGDGADGAPPFPPAVVSAVALTVVLSVFAHGLTAVPAVAAYRRRLDRLHDGAPEHKPATELPVRRSALHRRPPASPAAVTGPQIIPNG